GVNPQMADLSCGPFLSCDKTSGPWSVAGGRSHELYGGRFCSPVIAQASRVSTVCNSTVDPKHAVVDWIDHSVAMTTDRILAIAGFITPCSGLQPPDCLYGVGRVGMIVAREQHRYVLIGRRTVEAEHRVTLGIDRNGRSVKVPAGRLHQALLFGSERC